jgi:hypothetical protein
MEGEKKQVKRKAKQPKTVRRTESKRLAEADRREILELARRCMV